MLVEELICRAQDKLPKDATDCSISIYQDESLVIWYSTEYNDYDSISFEHYTEILK